MSNYNFSTVDYGTAICPVCKKEFQKKSANHMYCSETCKKKSYYNTAALVDSVIHGDGDWIECAYCGRFFLRPYKSKTLYCSEDCKIEARMQYDTDQRFLRRMKGVKIRKESTTPSKARRKKDGFTWDDIRAVFGEFGISSYQKALNILERRRNGETVEPPKPERAENGRNH